MEFTFFSFELQELVDFLLFQWLELLLKVLEEGCDGFRILWLG
jgi:hypothetical protein